MDKKNFLLQLIRDTKVLPLYYHDDYELCEKAVQACYNVGIRIFEFINRGEKALAHFAKLKAHFSAKAPDLYLGIGTIYTAEQAKNYHALGADFIIQPVCTPEVGDYCKKNDLLWIPGAMTLQEIYQAHQLGADIVKVFPASVLGMDYIKAIKGPLPQVSLMVTGGISAQPEVITQWLKSGAIACGLGSNVFNPHNSTQAIEASLKYLIQSLNLKT